MHRLLHTHRLPTAAFHHVVHTPNRSYELDFALVEHRIDIEVDGWAHHGSRRAFEADRERDAELVAAGWHRPAVHLAPGDATTGLGRGSDRRCDQAADVIRPAMGARCARQAGHLGTHDGIRTQAVLEAGGGQARAARTERAMPSASRPSRARIWSGLPWARNVDRHAQHLDRAAPAGRSARHTLVDGVEHQRAHAALADAVLDRHHDAVAGGVGDHRRVERLGHPDVPQRDVDALVGQRGHRPLGVADQLAEGQHAHPPVARPQRLGPQPEADLEVADLAGLALRVADGDRPVAQLEGVVQHLVQLLGRRRRHHRHARHLGEQREVVHAVVRRARRRR